MRQTQNVGRRLCSKAFKSKDPMPGALAPLQTLPIWAVIGLELARSGVFTTSPAPLVCHPEPPRAILADTLSAVQEVQRQITLSRECAVEDAPQSERPESTDQWSTFVAAAVGGLSGPVCRVIVGGIRTLFNGGCCAGRRAAHAEAQGPPRIRRRGRGILA